MAGVQCRGPEEEMETDLKILEFPVHVLVSRCEL